MRVGVKALYYTAGISIYRTEVLRYGNLALMLGIRWTSRLDGCAGYNMLMSKSDRNRLMNNTGWIYEEETRNYIAEINSTEWSISKTRNQV